MSFEIGWKFLRIFYFNRLNIMIFNYSAKDVRHNLPFILGLKYLSDMYLNLNQFCKILGNDR